MPFPAKKDIYKVYIGIFFLIFCLIMAMCDRWQLQLVIPGYPTRKPHAFNHTFLLWWLRMLMQFGLLHLWKAIDTNWCGFSRFRHGDKEPRENEDQAPQRVGLLEEEEPNPALIGIAQDGGFAPEEPDDLEDMADLDGRDGLDDLNNLDIPEDEIGENGRLINEEGVRRRRIFFPPRPDIPRPRPRPQKNYTKLLYFPPAFFDVSHVLLVYFGIQLTYPSSFMMLKGTMPFFATILSVAFLAQQWPLYIWVGVVLATLGVGSLGISDYVHLTPSGYEKFGIAAGDLQIAMGQIMFATKLIYEEKFISKHSIHPMKFLGSEASYGLFFASLILLIFNFVDGVQISEMPNGNIEDIVDACWQMAADWRAPTAFFGSLLSYMVYTYLGLFLVRDQGAMARLMLELIAWVTYWAICILLDWEKFYYVAQGPGIVVALIGLLFFAHILVLPFLNYTCGTNKDKEEVIGPDDDNEGLDGDVELIRPDGIDVEADGDDDQPLLQV